jgi:hypothetical protein
VRFKLLLFAFAVVSQIAITQNITWYYTWNNSINDLEKAHDEKIPVLYNGSNYRIMKVEGFTNQIDKIEIYSSNVSTEIFRLPIMEDYNRDLILDVMLPMSEKNTLINRRVTDQYFLVKFMGKQHGEDTVNFYIISEKQRFKTLKNIIVSNKPYYNKMNMNNWSYFDYSYQTRGLKNNVIADLVKHNSNVLVIPPAYIPSISSPNPKDQINKLIKYIQGTENKFDYYVLFLGYTSEYSLVLTNNWKKNVPIWYKTISDIFESAGINSNKVIIYPYDEPKGANIERLSKVYDYFRSVGIKNKFFVTIGNVDAAKLAGKIEIIQVATHYEDRIEHVNLYRSKLSQIWLYEILAGSRNYNVKIYHRLGFKAYKYNANGIGVWNYADSDKSFNESNRKNLAKSFGSWQIKASNPIRDYSLIYRKNNSLFSSIRWEALSYGMEETYWLSLFEETYGQDKCDTLVNDILSNKVTQKQWETVKFNLIN